MEPVRPSALQTVAKMADALVYAVAAGGVIAGGLLFRDDHLGFAVLAWCLTLVAGAGLRVAAWALKALGQLLLRTERLVEEVADLRTAGPATPEPGPRHGDAPPDPYRRWGSWH